MNAYGRRAIGRLGVLFEVGSTAGLDDDRLVARFLSDHAEASEAAFAALVARHGPMVHGVCRRMLPDSHDADDAFQAVFVILARRAGSIRVEDTLGRWLYGVARKVAGRARKQAARRRELIRDLGHNWSLVAGREADAELIAERDELRSVIDDEVARLPSRYRDAIVCCHLEGLGIEETSRRLGHPSGTVKSRLARGRELLRSRLARRGLAPTTATIATLLLAEESRAAARTAVAGELANQTIRAAVRCAAAGPAATLAAGAVSATVVSLSEGAFSMFGMLKVAAVAAVPLGMLGSSAIFALEDGPAVALDKPAVAQAVPTIKPRVADVKPATPSPEPLRDAISAAPGFSSDLDPQGNPPPPPDAPPAVPLAPSELATVEDLINTYKARQKQLLDQTKAVAARLESDLSFQQAQAAKTEADLRKARSLIETIEESSHQAVDPVAVYRTSGGQIGAAHPKPTASPDNVPTTSPSLKPVARPTSNNRPPAAQPSALNVVVSQNGKMLTEDIRPVPSPKTPEPQPHTLRVIDDMEFREIKRSAAEVENLRREIRDLKELLKQAVPAAKPPINQPATEAKPSANKF
ncbi:MAG: sigma-70 family RNA polymerase sigma factor [Planctomycetota bacterium]|nr:sigma-70 family RNA polymerase sigma factor [Planctomycetota bacterium]